MNRAELAEMLAVIAGAWPGGQFTGRTVEVYRGALADLDFEPGRRALQRLVNFSKFLPTIAEIRLATDEIVHGPKRLGLEAWGDVVKQIQRTGAYGEPRFDDPVVAECVRVLGWRNLCLTENETADRARFVELYGGLSERARLDRVSGVPLPPPAHAARRLAAARGNGEPTGPTPIAGALPGRRS